MIRRPPPAALIVAYLVRDRRRRPWPDLARARAQLANPLVLEALARWLHLALVRQAQRLRLGEPARKRRHTLRDRNADHRGLAVNL